MKVSIFLTVNWIFKRIKKIKLEISNYSSESISNKIGIHKERGDSYYEVECVEYLNWVKEFTDIPDLKEKETRDLIKSFYEDKLSQVDVLHNNIKGLSKTTVYIIYHKLSTSGEIDRKPGFEEKARS